MAVPSSAADFATEAFAWQELEDVFGRLGRLARSPVSSSDFYRTALQESVRALSAIGGAAWLRGEDGVFRPVAQYKWGPAEFASAAERRAAHEALLIGASEKGGVTSVSTSDSSLDSGDPLSQNANLLLAPVRLERISTPDTIAAAPEPPAAFTVAIIEMRVRADVSPSAHRGYEQFLSAICEVAADYHAFRQLERLRGEEAYRERLLRFGQRVHRRLDLAETCYSVANDGRGVIGCDRLSVLLWSPNGRCRLLAMSGLDRVEERSAAARGLERIAALVARTGEPAYYDGESADALPPVAEAVDQHVEASQARQLAAVPLARTPEIREAEFGGQKRGRRQKDAAFVLIAEQFDVPQNELSRQRLVQTAEVSATALYNALEVDWLPLAWLLRPLGAARNRVAASLPRYVLAAAAIAAAIAILILVPADFNVEATGTVQPVVRREIFAPRDGLVEQVLVSHGQHVAQADPLVQLLDPALEFEMKRISGEIETVERQLDAVRAAKTGRAIRDAAPSETYRLSAEERELEQRLTNLRTELQLFSDERENLVVRSAIAGEVITWDTESRLAGRPVARGEALLTVADLSADWQLELDVAGDDIGYVTAGRGELGPGQSVRFRLSSDDLQARPIEGRIVQISRTANVSREANSPPTVRVDVAFDAAAVAAMERDPLRPGLTARAQIACGRRSLGYVWLHDIWEAVVGWIRF
jgi:multidrug resistance efflux pump